MGFRGYRCAQPTATRGTIPCGEFAREAVVCVVCGGFFPVRGNISLAAGNADGIPVVNMSAPTPFLPCKGLHRCVWHYATRIGELKDISVFPGGEYSLFSPGLSAAIPRVLNNPFFVSDRNHQNLGTGGFLSETMRCVMGSVGIATLNPRLHEGQSPAGNARAWWWDACVWFAADFSP